MNELKINASILLGVFLSIVATSFIYEPKSEYIYFLMGSVVVILMRVISARIIKNRQERGE